VEGVTRESMRPLLDLQRVDSAVDRLNQRKADLPEQRELDELNEQRSTLAVTNAEAQASLDAVAREQTKLETEIQQIDDKVSHEQGRLYSGEISNPKELANIQAELDALRRRKAHLEDQELEVMEQREGIEKEHGDVATTLADLNAKVADATQRRDHASVEIEDELKSLAAERAQLVPVIHPEVIELYEDIRARRGGVAVGALVDGTCRACGLPLSPMQRDEIKRSDDPIIRCENCRRLLVIP
jgi:predicted  nucleic acid-binding Zn-ribbon protein